MPAKQGPGTAQVDGTPSLNERRVVNGSVPSHWPVNVILPGPPPATMVIVLVGLTVIVYTHGIPGQPLAVSVIVIVPDIGASVALVATKEGTLPTPAAARPIAGLVFVQLKVVPATGPDNTTAAIVTPAHTVWLTGAVPVNVGVGLTVIVKVIGAPTQLTPALVNVGVTVIVAVTGTLLILMPVKAAILPEPFAFRPIVILLLLQL